MTSATPAQSQHHRRYLLWLSVGTVVMALAMGGLLVFQLAQKKAIQQASTLRSDSITALVFGVEREFLRFRQTLDQAMYNPDALEADAITLRYDILLSRIELLRGGPSAEVLANKPQFVALMEKLTALIESTDEVMQHGVLDRSQVVALLAQYNALGPDVQKLSLVANSEVSELLELQSKTMLEQNQLVVELASLQLVLLLIAASALAVRQRRQHVEREALERLTVELRAAEQRALVANQGLEEKVRDRTKELSGTLENLKSAQSQLIQSEKLATLGQIVANVAHEINTPIGAVKSSGESISVALNRVLAGFPALVLSLDEATRNLFFALVTEVRKPAEPLSTREERALNRAVRAELEAADIPDAQTKADWLLGLKVRQLPMRFAALLQHPRAEAIFEMANQIATIIHSADNINLAVERVAKIIFALKSFSHTDASGEFQPVDLKAGMETVLTIYSNQIKQGVEVTREYGDVGLVECLPDELNQVWTNLIHNALQAMNNQGKLQIAMQAQDHGVRVSITDNGPGIPLDIQTRIFDPFFTTKPVGEGSGLGLDIARKIVDKHHGRLELHSEVGVGTTFSVWLPLQQAT